MEATVVLVTFAQSLYWRALIKELMDKPLSGEESFLLAPPPHTLLT